MFKKKEPTPQFIKRMKGQDYIDSTRKYLDYLEEHLNNVAKAFSELSEACNGKEYWVGDDFTWWTFKAEVEAHDLSKFSKEEFVQYRDNFFHVCDEDKESSNFHVAWENHKDKNHHHHETAEHYIDIVHMVIDWIAMSYKFGDNPRDFYNKTKPSMNIDEKLHQYVDELFSHLEEYRAMRNAEVRHFTFQIARHFPLDERIGRCQRLVEVKAIGDTAFARSHGVRSAAPHPLHRITRRDGERIRLERKTHLLDGVRLGQCARGDCQRCGYNSDRLTIPNA